MCAWRPWPYAATAIVQHEWDTDQLNVWLIFKYPMDQTVKPAHDLWICLVDDVPKAITVSAWQDEWTILLTVPDVLALPGRVTLEYDGPDGNLKTTWEKQWEPWGPILSKRIPYLWEDILVVDTVNKRVGIQPGVPLAAPPFLWALSIISPNGDEQVGLYHDDSDAVLITSAGNMKILPNAVGDLILFGDTDVANDADGKHLKVYRRAAEGDAYADIYITQYKTFSFIARGGPLVINSDTGNVRLQSAGGNDVANFDTASEGQVRAHRVYGWKAGDTERRHVDLQISPNANNTALWSGVGDYVFDGNIRAVGRLVSGTLTHSAVGPTDDLDVSDVNTVFIDCSANDVTIGAFVSGVDGQVLRIVRLCATVNDVTLEHNEGTGNQNIFLHKGFDETLTGEYGGWELVCNGTSWFDVSHAKHV